MRTAARILAGALVACCALSLATSDAEAKRKPNRYSVVTLVNKTPFRVYYDYRWGETRKRFSNSIAPKKSYVHWWTFKRPDENYAPFFYVRLDGDSDWYELRSFYSPDTDASNGREYAFKARKVGDTWEITLVARLYTK